MLTDGPQVGYTPGLTYECPYYDSATMIRFFKGTVTHRKKEWWLVSEGPTGSGKSTTKDQICKRIDPRISLEDSIFDLRHLLDVMEDNRKNQVYNIDEAVNIFHNQDWATWHAKALSKLIRQMRIMRSFWALAIPDFEGLHPYLRDYQTRSRFYHRPVFDADGMGNGPPMPLWKQERFDFKENRVTTRWQALDFEPMIESLDHDPQHRAYEQTKEENFIRQVKEIKHRLGLEDEKEQRQLASGKKGAGMAAKRPAPPTTT